MEWLVWLCAGVGAGLFCAMSVLALVAAADRRRLGRRVRGAARQDRLEVEPPRAETAAPVAVAAPAQTEVMAAGVVAAETGAPANISDTRPAGLDVEALFAEAFAVSPPVPASAAEVDEHGEAPVAPPPRRSDR